MGFLPVGWTIIDLIFRLLWVAGHLSRSIVEESHPSFRAICMILNITTGETGCR